MITTKMTEQASRSTTDLALKRALDLVVSGLGLLVLSPLMVAIAAAVRLDSRGPVFFRQERLGLNGHRFRVWKFRTMVSDAEKRLQELELRNESSGGVLFKMKQDPRVTRVGAFLRRTSLDEIPQLFNIFLGQMSLVGPRPLQLRDCALASDLHGERFAKRSAVVPGLTGLWQVSGRSEVGFDRMLELDLNYIDRWSLGLDLYILWRTLLVVLASKGAY